MPLNLSKDLIMLRIYSCCCLDYLARSISAKSNRMILFGALVLLMCGSSGVQVNDEFRSKLSDAFSLNDGQIIRLVVNRTAGQPARVEITIDGNNYTLELQPEIVRAANFVFQVQLADGTYSEMDPAPSRTMRGSVVGVEGSRVAGSMLEAGFAGKIVMGDGQTWFVEPLASRMDGADLENLHVLYGRNDQLPHGGSCGFQNEAVDHGHEGNFRVDERKPVRATGNIQNVMPRGGVSSQVAELAVDADFEYFTSYGTEQATLDRMELIVNIVNDQYESDVSLTHVISVAIVRMSEPDPYSSTSSFGLLNQFRNQWLKNHAGLQRDVAHLFTGKEIDGSVIGRAWELGAICNDGSYCFSQSDFNGMLACATDLTAHELGHLWNGSHCSCTEHTMNPFITCANDFNQAFTVPDIIAYRDTLTCLDDPTGPCDDPPGDINGDGNVNLLDIDGFIDRILTGTYQCEADTNEDGFVNLLDVTPFVFILGGP